MPVRLPKPLPYEVVDELIDANYKFGEDTWETEDGVTYTRGWCRRLDGSCAMYHRPIFEFIYDDGSNDEEDADGYILWEGGPGVLASQPDWSDKEVDKFLSIGKFRASWYEDFPS
jgi:hypothetical protein